MSRAQIYRSVTRMILENMTHQVPWILDAVQSQQALQSAPLRLCQEVMAPWRVNFCYSLQPCMHVRSLLTLTCTAVDGHVYHAQDAA